jgi:hypothetical protein
MNYLRPLVWWEHGFESHYVYECLRALFLFVFSCVQVTACDGFIACLIGSDDYVYDLELKKRQRAYRSVAELIRNNNETS